VPLCTADKKAAGSLKFRTILVTIGENQRRKIQNKKIERWEKKTVLFAGASKMFLTHD
jgi:hypothetical protein